MTERAEIERLLNQTGRTLEGLPSSYSMQEVDNRFKGIIVDWRFGDFVLHQSDVIELLVGALRDALKEAEKQKELVELNRFLLDAADKALEEAEKNVPAIDAVPVVHARWQDHHCTNCYAMCVTARSPQGWAYNIETRQCPNCGARMDGESEEDTDGSKTD